MVYYSSRGTYSTDQNKTHYLIVHYLQYCLCKTCALVWCYKCKNYLLLPTLLPADTGPFNDTPDLFLNYNFLVFSIFDYFVSIHLFMLVYSVWCLIFVLLLLRLYVADVHDVYIIQLCS